MRAVPSMENFGNCVVPHTGDESMRTWDSSHEAWQVTDSVHLQLNGQPQVEVMVSI